MSFRAATALLVAGVCALLAVPAAAKREEAKASLPTTATSSCPTTASAKAQFTVATYNVNYGNVDLKTVAATIRQGGASVVALQETNDASAAYLRRALTNLYPHMSFRGDKWAGGFGLLSKVPLTAVKYAGPTGGGWFGTYTARAKLAGREVLLVNVHLKPTLPQQGDTVISLLRRLGTDEQVRATELKAILKTIPKDAPAIVLGDFNSMPSLCTRPLMLDRGFTDSLAAANDGAEGMATWHWKFGQTTYRLRLDYLYHGPELITVSSVIIPSEASDHFLQVSGLAWKVTTSGPTTRPG